MERLSIRLGAVPSTAGEGLDLCESSRLAADGSCPRLPEPLLLYAVATGRTDKLWDASPMRLRSPTGTPWAL